MRRVLFATTILSLLVPLWGPVAADPGSDTLSRGAVREVEAPDRELPSPVPLPRPEERDEPNGLQGPLALGSDLTVARGSAMVLPRGGSVMNARQRADREIRRMIRRLG